jgi:hypothetical protein
MQADVRRKLSMAARALDYSRAQPSTDAGHTTVVTRLEERVARADALAIQERDGRVGERAATTLRRELRIEIQEMLRHLVRTAKVAGRSDPALAGDFVLPKLSGPYRTFATSAKAMLAAASPLKDALAANGLGDTLLDDLTTALEKFDEATTAAHTARREHVGGRADLIAVADECVEQVRLLDGLNRKRFKTQPELLAAWESASNVVGPFKSKGVETPTATGETPTAPDATAEAA